MVSPGHSARKQYRPGAGGAAAVLTASGLRNLAGRRGARREGLTPAAVPPVVHRAVESAAVRTAEEERHVARGRGRRTSCPWTTARSVAAVPVKPSPTVVPALGVVVGVALQARADRGRSPSAWRSSRWANMSRQQLEALATQVDRRIAEVDATLVELAVEERVVAALVGEGPRRRSAVGRVDDAAKASRELPPHLDGPRR